MSKRILREMPWVMIIAFAIALVLAAALVRPAHADGPTVTVDVWREIPSLQLSGGKGLSTPGPALFTEEIFADHVFVKNNGADRIPAISITGSFNHPYSVFIGWAGVGPNAQAWRLESFWQSHYKVSYSPPAGIGPGGVAEVMVWFRAEPFGRWPLSKTVPTIEHHVVITDSSERDSVDQLSSTLSVPRDEDWFYGWGGEGWGESRPGEFAFYRAGEYRGAVRSEALLRINYVTPIRNVLTFSRERWLAGTNQPLCESEVRPNVSGQVFFRQGNCGWPQVNPHLRQGVQGKSVPVSVDPSRPYGSIWTVIGADIEGKSVYYRVYADAGGELVVQVLKGGFDRPTVVTTIEVRIPRGQALELTIQGIPNVTHFTFWNDQHGWKYVPRSASPEEGEPLWSLWSLNQLLIHSDGTAWYTELPYNRS